MSYRGIRAIFVMALTGAITCSLAFEAKAFPSEEWFHILTQEIHVQHVKKTPKKKRRKRKKIRHRVKKGETLGKIAALYGVRVKDLKRWNRIKDETKLQIGQKLVVYAKRLPPTERAKRKEIYKVRKGDYLSKIAKRLKVSEKDLKKWNRSLRRHPDKLKVGQEIVVWREGPAQSSESVGRANRGRLLHGEKLPRGKYYIVRTPKRAYGTNQTITHLITLTRKMHQKYPKAHRLVIGDISAQGGGKLRPHKSHQSGRDVDVGYYHKGLGQPTQFVRVTSKNLDLEKTWYFIQLLLKTHDVEYLFIDRKVQKMLYQYARSKGVSKKKLEKIMQYPRRPGTTSAIIRHEKGHRNHIHIRFKCPPEDRRCR